MDEADLLVIGGGISGLALARMAGQVGWRTQLLEAGPALGGCMRTHRSERAPGFWLELGAHTCFNSYGHLLDLIGPEAPLQRLGRQRLPFRLWRDGKTASIVSQLEPLGFLGGALRMPFVRKRGRSVERYFGALAGTRNFRRVLGPALDAVACQPVSAFPAEYLFRRKPRRRGIPRSFTYEGGLQGVAETLGTTATVSVALCCRARALERRAGAFVVQSEQGTFSAPRLALAVPPQEAARLLRPIRPKLAMAIAAIGESEVESTAVVALAEAVRLPPIAGLIGREQPFYSVVSRDVVPAADYRGLTFHFRPGRLDEAEKLALIATVVGTSDLVDVAHARHRLPALQLGHGERIRAIEALRGNLPLALVGNWLEGLSLEDCAGRAVAEFEWMRRLGGA